MAVQAQYPANAFRVCNGGIEEIQLLQQSWESLYPTPASHQMRPFANFYNAAQNPPQQQQMLNATVFSDPESELTCNLSGPRKRTRVDPPASLLPNSQQHGHQSMRFVAVPEIPAAVDSRAVTSSKTSTSRCPSAATLAQDLAGCLQQQGLEMDALIQVHSERMMAGLQEARRRQWRVMTAAAEEAVLRRLREKEAELEAAGRRNVELEERVRQLAAENQVWFSVAKNSEAIVSNLRATLDQLLRQSAHAGAACDEGYGDSSDVIATAVADDAQSCHPDTDDGDSTSRVCRRTCRVCRKNEVSVLLLPCRHLCLCRECESKGDTCPACDSAKSASLQIFLS